MIIKNKIMRIILIIVILLFIVVAYFSLPCFLIVLSGWFSPNPPQPEITYGEFPFEVVYETNSEIVTVQDTYVCEYDGVDINEGVGKHRVWNGYIKGTGESAIILKETEKQAIYCTVGTPKYYMDDLDEYAIKSEFPDLFVLTFDEKGEQISYLSKEEAFVKHDIKLLSWSFSNPIENTYKKNLYYKFCEMIEDADDKISGIINSVISPFGE